MGSAAIAAALAAKQAELEQVTKTKTQVDKVSEIVGCVSSKFSKAGELIAEAGSIDGQPFDAGKTAEAGVELGNIEAKVNASSNALAAKIAALQAEIAALEAALAAALAAEAAAAAAAEEAARKKR